MPVYSEVFNTYGVPGGVLETVNDAFKANWLGYLGTDIPPEYLIRIINKRPPSILSEGQSKYIQITAPLQEKITTKMQASWSPLSAGNFITDVANRAMTFATGRSLVSRFNSRRIWTGTTPLSFTLSLKFEAINDTASEVTEPVKELQRMVLPYSSIGGVGGKLLEKFSDKTRSVVSSFFLAPPGPDPLNIPGISWLKKEGTGYESEEITIHIGKLMTLKNVVLKDVTVDHNPRFEKGGSTISSVATVTFETFEILTKEALDSLYPSSEQRKDKAPAPAKPEHADNYKPGQLGRSISTTPGGSVYT